MSIDNKSYELLLHEYNTMEANLKTVKQELDLHKEQTAKREKEYGLTEKAIREFCDIIINKDSQMHTLGKNASAGRKLTISELLDKTLESYNLYIKKKTDILKQLQDKLESQYNQIESLKEQINRYMTSGKTFTSGSLDVTGKASFVEDGGMISDISDDEETEYSIEDICEDESDYVDEEGCVITDLINKAKKKKKKYKATPSSPTSSPVSAYEKGEKIIDTGYYMQVDDVISHMDTNHKLILSLISAMGLYTFDSIKNIVDTKYSELELKDKHIRVILSTLEKTQVIVGEFIKIPIKGSFKVYRITDLGAVVYKKLTGKEPVNSKIDSIIAEHDNMNHGMGILLLQEYVESNPERMNVTSFNRKNPCILPQNNRCKYIPDIKYIKKHGDNEIPYYIEYEKEKSGYNQQDWIDKLNKMINFTRVMMIVVDNQDTLNEITKLTSKWVESKGNVENLSGIVCKICTITYYKEKIAEDDSFVWQVEYDFNKSAEPVVQPKF